MGQDILSVVSFVIGVVSFVTSIIFFILSSRSEQRNQVLLDKINTAIQSWQGKIIESNIELLNSRVEIVGKQVALEDAKAKNEFIQNLSERIKSIIENPAPEGSSAAQSHQLGQILNTFEATTKSVLPPEVIAQIASKN